MDPLALASKQAAIDTAGGVDLATRARNVRGALTGAQKWRIARMPVLWSAVTFVAGILALSGSCRVVEGELVVYASSRLSTLTVGAVKTYVPNAVMAAIGGGTTTERPSGLRARVYYAPVSATAVSIELLGPK